MKLLPLLAVFCQIAWTLGSPVADADADADADAQYNGFPFANTRPYNPNMGGPGYGQPMATPYLDPATADDMEGYGTLDIPESGNVAPDPYQQYPAYVPGQASNYARGPAPQPQFNEPAPDMTGYGSVNYMPDAGNVQPVPEGFNNFMSPPIYNSPPMQNYPSMPMNNFNNNPISSGPDATRPPAPIYKPYVPLQAQYAPLNIQGRPFTRSYTPIQGTNGNCMNVCRTRPMYNARPVCRPSCNVRPSCGRRRPQVDYVRKGQTTFCNAKPLRRPMPVPRPLPQPINGGGCGTSTCGGSGYNNGNGGSGYNNGNGGSGYNNGGSGYYPDNGGSGYNNGNGGSGYNNGNGGSVYYPDNGGSGYNTGGCGGSTCGGSGYNTGEYGGSGYNSGNGGSGYNTGCSSGTCGSSYPSYPQEQVQTLPGQLGSWADEPSFDDSAPDAGVEEEISSDPVPV